MLCIDADVDARGLMTRSLQDAGVIVVAGHQPADRPDIALARVQPDLVLLDPGAPELIVPAVAAVCAATPVPVIVVSRYAEDVDVARSLGAGAHDHIGKPWSPVELNARVLRALRPRATRSRRPSSLVIGNLEVHLLERQVFVSGVEVHLTTLEFELLRLLASRPGSVFDRATLLQQIWGHGFADRSTVAVHVRRLRAKIERDPADPQLLRTRWGVGYFLADSASFTTEEAAGANARGPWPQR